MIVVEYSLVEELVMHGLVMATISGGIVVKRKYVKGYRPNLTKIRIVRRKETKNEK